MTFSEPAADRQTSDEEDIPRTLNNSLFTEEKAGLVDLMSQMGTAIDSMENELADMKSFLRLLAV